MKRPAIPRSKFRPGQRVQLSELGVAMGLQGLARTDRGTVVSVFQGCIRLKRDGIRFPETYAERYWEPI